MLMSRDSSFGATGFRSMDRSTNMKSLMDDAIMNQKLQEKYQNRRKFGQEDSDEEEPDTIQFKIKKDKPR